MTTDSSAFSPLAVLGVGYIGGSLALAARDAGLVSRIVGYDVDERASASARSRGILDDVCATPEAAVAGAAMVVLCAPVASLAPLARRIAPALSPAALVIDVGSVKAPVVREVEAMLPGQFVGCHPLAGAEHAGVDAADGGIFRGRVCFVCRGPSVEGKALATATAFWQRLGARVVAMDPEPHDACMAAVSHLPHVAAFALAASLLDALAGPGPTQEALAPTTSAKDTTRIAASSPAVWRDIFLENRGPLLPLVRALEGRVAAISAAIAAGDGATLEALLAAGRAGRNRLMAGDR